jgi:predicted dehydrogenase
MYNKSFFSLKKRHVLLKNYMYRISVNDKRGILMKNNKKSYRVGIVGTGWIAYYHGRACSELDCVELHGICDVSKKALNIFGYKFRVTKRYLDLDKMLDEENLDIMIICTWGAYHEEVATRISNSNKVKAILCEKPFAQTSKEAEKMVDAANNNGVLIAEAFKFRHHPMHLKAKELVRSKALGELMSIRSTFQGGGGGVELRKPEYNWRFNKAQGGGSIYDLGCYCIHHARFIFDAEPLSVFAQAQPGIEVDDAAYLLLTFPDNKVAQISVGFNSLDSQYLEICGTMGSLYTDIAWNNEDHETTLRFRRIVDNINYKTELFEFWPVFQFTNQLQHLCDCLSTGCQHRISPVNSVNQMKVLDAAIIAMETGEVVKI